MQPLGLVIAAVKTTNNEARFNCISEPTIPETIRDTEWYGLGANTNAAYQKGSFPNRDFRCVSVCVCECSGEMLAVVYTIDAEVINNFKSACVLVCECINIVLVCTC